MKNKPDQTPDTAEMKKQLEGLTGHEINADGEQLINLRFPASTYSYEEGSSVWKSIFLPGKTCTDATLLDVSGYSFTGADGHQAFLLSDFVCFDPLHHPLAEPINLVATPRLRTPAFLTMTHSLVPTGDDVQITVFSWAADGSPAPNVPFDWRCRVVAIKVIL